MPHIFEKTHYKNSQVYDTDDLILSHNSNVDFSMTVGQIQSMPVGTCATGASTAAKVVNLASDSFGLFTIKDKNDQTKALLGRTISVNFTNKNTATSMTLNVASTGAYPVTSHGVAVKAGAIGSGNYTFRFMPYGTSYSWDVLDNNGLIEVTNTEMTFWDGHKELTADQVNSALANLISVDTNITLTSALEGLSFSNVNIRKTDISGKKVYNGSFKVEQNTSGAYFQIFVSGITAPSYVMGFWETSLGNYGIIQDMASDSRQFWFRTKSGEVIQASAFSNTTIRFIVFEL